MAEQQDKRPDRDELRKQAEKKVDAIAANMPDRISHEEMRHLIHELQVHQIELEMQNEELCRAQVELEASYARYFDLYDLAPVGYLTLSERGLIIEANLAVSNMLGVEIRDFVGQPLSHFIFPGDQDIYYRHRRQLATTLLPQECELRMIQKDNKLFWVNLSGTIVESGDKGSVSKVILSDINRRKMLEQEREGLIAELQKALGEIKILTGIIPICAGCKKIRNDKGSWDALEKYFMSHSDVKFSHGLCDECTKKYYPELCDKIPHSTDNPGSNER
jgi:PAS domain S-box-containing protein